MMKEQKMNDVAKEVSVVLEYLDAELLKKIPIAFIEYLKKLSVESQREVNIDKEKELKEQELLEESKDLLALIFYSYLANEDEKKEIVKCWDDNEKEYQDILKEEYKITFEKEYSYKNISEEKSLIIKNTKGRLFNKIKDFIYKYLKIKR